MKDSLLAMPSVYGNPTLEGCLVSSIVLVGGGGQSAKAGCVVLVRDGADPQKAVLRSDSIEGAELSRAFLELKALQKVHCRLYPDRKEDHVWPGSTS